jgi:hypothetical protein
MKLPIDPRGSGLGETRAPLVTRSTAAARLPLAYAWELLSGMQEDDPPPIWSWPQRNEATGVITPGNAIAVAVRDLCQEEPSFDERDKLARSSRTLVVPNFLEEHQQEHLLRALRIEVGSARLLWRPISAALTWLKVHGESLARDPEQFHTVGSLLHLHLGAEHWEATVLELVQFIDDNGTAWVLPGRRIRNRELGAPLLGWPTRWLEQTAESVLTNGHPPTDARRWNLLWASSWAPAALLDDASRASARANLPPWIAPSLADAGRQLLAAKLYTMPGHSGPGSRWPLTEELLTTRNFSPDPEAWLPRLRSGLRSTQLRGAVVTGPYAALPVDGGGTLGSNFVANLVALPASSILIEGTSPASSAVCARGAAEFGRRSVEGQPTYLDTLPSVSMVAMVLGEPEWINLLETDAQWVMGSEVWSKEPEKTRFSIQKGERELTVVVHRGGSPTCRRVKTEFSSPAAESSPVSLHVSITPGQGAPRVEVRPDDRRMLQGRSLTLDWTTAEDTGRNTSEELDSIDRICPRHEPRSASEQKWALHRFQIEGSPIGIRDLVKLYLKGQRKVVRTNGSPEAVLGLIKDMVRQWDPRINLGWATAVSSDFSLHSNDRRDATLLDDFVNALNDIAQATTDEAAVALRTLAAMSAYTPHVKQVISRFLTQGYASYHDPVWVVAGHCIREPDECRRMLEIAEQSGSFNAYKQAARVLMFRREALATTPAATAGKLLRRAANDARAYSRRHQFQQAFQECALLCAYLLRTRIYYPDFAAPGSQDYQLLESTFAAALKNMQQGRVMGGVIDKKQLVQDILDYTRSRGRGRLVVYAQD